MARNDDWLEGGDTSDDDVKRELGDTVESGKGCVVSKSMMLKILGMSSPPFDKLIRQGCPVVTRGSRTLRWEFNTAEVIKWIRARDITEATQGNPNASDGPDEFDLAKTREKEAHARLREIDIAKREGELLDKAVVTSWVSKRFGEFRARMLQIPPSLISFTAEQREEVKVQINEALGELSGVPHGESESPDESSEQHDSAGTDEEIIT